MSKLLETIVESQIKQWAREKMNQKRKCEKKSVTNI